MRRSVFVLPLLLAAAAALEGCRSPMGAVGAPSSGPAGTGECDACARAEVTPPATEGSGAAASAAADGGQRASNQPVMSDPARIQPQTVWNRGAGPNTNSPTSTDVRSQAGAPSVNQGLVLPTNAIASANAADSPAVKAVLERLADLRAAWKDAIARGAVDQAKALSDQMDVAEARLLSATASAGGGQTTNVYDLRGARVSQIVANGSKSGDGPGGSISPDTATAVGGAADKVVDATMKGTPTEIPEGPPSGLPAPTPEPGAPR